MTTSLEMQLKDAAYAGNYTLFNSLVSKFTSTTAAQMSQQDREDILNKLSEDVWDGQDWGNSTLIKDASNAIRVFMVKFGATTDALTVEIALENLAYAANNANSKNFDAIDAITDNMTAAAKAQLSQVAREYVISNIAQNVADGVNWGNVELTNASTSALRDFMNKFGATTSVYAVEIGLSYLVRAAVETSAGSASAIRAYAAIDAITDNLTAAARSEMSQFTREEVIDSITENILDGQAFRNTELETASTDALRDFLVKVGASTDALVLALPVETLAQARNFDALDAIFDNIASSEIADLKSLTQSVLDAQNIRVLTHGANTYTGTAASETIYAMQGADLVKAGAGADRVYGGAGSDYLYGDDGNDILYGESSADYLFGGKGADTLLGGDDGDTLQGQDGNDILNGGAHTDQLTGGLGADTFAFGDINTGFDVIRDFSKAQGDKLDLSAVLEKFDPLTHAIADFVKVTSVPEGSFVHVDVDGKGAGAAVVVALLENVSASTLNVTDMYNAGQLIA